MSEVLSSVSWSSIGIELILVVVFLLILFFSFRKNKNKHSLSKEIDNYKTLSQQSPQTGVLSLVPSGLCYSRGSRSVIFPVKIEKNTLLAPCLIEPWFIDRNYNKREEDAILQDCYWFLISSGVCKNVNIVSDEEYSVATKIS